MPEKQTETIGKKEKLLGIEQVFKEKDDERMLFDKYRILKNELLTHEYVFTLVNFRGGVDHGPGHIKRVIERADELLSSEVLNQMELYEFFILLLSALYHDEGLLKGREDHPKKSAELAWLDAENYITRREDIEYITKIVEVHGRKGDIDRTFSAHKDREKIGGDWIQPKFLAALLRLADELDEDFQRAEERVKRKIELPLKSEIFWEVPQRIKGIDPNPEKEAIYMRVALKKEDLLKEKYQVQKKQVSLIEALLEKLCKINKERKYCVKFFPKGLMFKRISVDIVLPGTEYEENPPITIEFNKHSNIEDIFEDYSLLKPLCNAEHLPEISDFLDKKESEKQEVRRRKKFKNPFEIESAESFELKEISRYLVREGIDFYTITSKESNTIIEGPRGCGKTMIMKSLSLESQLSEPAFQENPLEYFKTPEAFWGVYCKIEEGTFNKEEYLMIKDVSLRNILFERHFVLYIGTQIVETLGYFFGKLKELRIKSVSRTKTERALIEEIITLLLEESATKHRELRSLDEIKKHVSEQQIKVSEYISMLGETITLRNLGLLVPQIPPVKPARNFDNFLYPLCRAIQRRTEDLIENKIPFFFLLDDMDNLFEFQQSVIMRLLRKRQYDLVCVKLSSQKKGIRVLHPPRGRAARAAREFEPVDLTELYIKPGDTYYKRMHQIAQSRLDAAGIKGIDITELLPKDKKENNLVKRVKREMREEWEKLRKKGRIPYENYLGKYKNSRLFQRLAKLKQPKDYSGFNNIVKISSGIASQFIRLCKGIFNEAFVAGDNVCNKQAAPPKIQNNKIIEISTDYFDSARSVARAASFKEAEGYKDLGIKVEHLLKILTKLFRRRLLNEESKEPEIVAVAVKEVLPDEWQTVFDIAVLESYLLERVYPAKSGEDTLPAYTLNRLVAPRRKLSVETIQGRIEISKQDVVDIFKNPDKFISKFSKPLESEIKELPLFPKKEYLR